MNYDCFVWSKTKSIVISFIYATLIYYFLPLSYDYISHLESAPYYIGERDNLTFLDYISINNIIPYIYNNLELFSPALIIQFTYFISGFIFSYFVLSRTDLILGLSILWANFITCLNTNREILAFVLFYYLINSKRKISAHIIPLIIHNTSIFAIFTQRKIRPLYIYIPVFILIFVLLNFNLPIRYGYSTNGSPIQNNFYPSLLALLLIIYSTNFSYIKNLLHIIVSISLIFFVLIEWYGFNQFIYFSRVVWILFMTVQLNYINNKNSSISLEKKVIFLSTLFIFGLYHIFYNIIVRV